MATVPLADGLGFPPRTLDLLARLSDNSRISSDLLELKLLDQVIP